MIPDPDEVIQLNKGQKAPYRGVFMPVDEFRYFKTTELEKEILEKKVVIPNNHSTALTIILSAIGGALLFSTIDGAIRHK